MLEKLEKLAPRERVMLLAAAISIFVLLVERTVVNAIRKELKHLNASIESREDVLRLHRWYVASGADIDPEYDRAEKHLELAGDPNDEMEAFNGRVDAIAVKSGVTCSDIDNRPPSRDGLFERYMLTVGKFDTTRDGFFTFLHQVQSAPGMLRVKELVMKPSKDDTRFQGEFTITKAMLSSSPAVQEESP